MARLQTIGFEIGANTANAEWDSSFNSPVNQSTIVRSGTYAGQITSLVSATRKGWRSTFSTASINGPYFVRAYLYVATRPSAANTIIKAGTDSDTAALLAGIKLNNDGSIALFDEDGQIGSDSSVLSLNTWYKIDLWFQRDAALPNTGIDTVKARLDDVEFASSATRSISVGFRAVALGGNLVAEAQTTGNWYFDDYAFNDNTGSFQTTYPNAGKVIYLFPNASGDSNQFLHKDGSAGDANNYQEIDEITPDDLTTYVKSNTLNDKDLYNLLAATPTIALVDSINVVQMSYRAAIETATGAADPTIRPRIKGGGVELTGSVTQWQATPFRNNNRTVISFPNVTTYDMPGASTVGILPTDLDSFQVGYDLSANGGGDTALITQAYLIVDYTPAPTSISFDATSNSGYKTASGSYSWAHTCNGGNRYLFVGISMLSVGGSSVSSITYNGIALTKIRSIASVSGAVRAEIWGLASPSPGTSNISVTLSTPLDSVGGAISLQGVHQTNPIEADNSASATNVGAADATVNVGTVADSDWVLDTLATDDVAVTVGAGQTQEWNVTGALGSGAGSFEGPQTPSGTVTMSWTNVGALATWSIAAVAVRPASTPSGNVPVRPRMQRIFQQLLAE